MKKIELCPNGAFCTVEENGKKSVYTQYGRLVMETSETVVAVSDHEILVFNGKELFDMDVDKVMVFPNGWYEVFAEGRKYLYNQNKEMKASGYEEAYVFPSLYYALRVMENWYIYTVNGVLIGKCAHVSHFVGNAGILVETQEGTKLLNLTLPVISGESFSVFNSMYDGIRFSDERSKLTDKIIGKGMLSKKYENSCFCFFDNQQKEYKFFSADGKLLSVSERKYLFDGRNYSEVDGEYNLYSIDGEYEMKVSNLRENATFYGFENSGKTFLYGPQGLIECDGFLLQRDNFALVIVGDETHLYNQFGLVL